MHCFALLYLIGVAPGSLFFVLLLVRPSGNMESKHVNRERISASMFPLSVDMFAFNVTGVLERVYKQIRLSFVDVR